MTIQGKLYAYEKQLESIEGWERTHWPDPTAPPSGMKVLRLVKDMGGGDRIMMHRFEGDDGNGYCHTHQYALGVHALGPAPYEVGFGIGGKCHTRTFCTGPFYYEMRTPELEHFVLPKGSPLYTVALWTPFEAPEKVPPPLQQDLLRHHEELIIIVQAAFLQHYPRLEP